MPIRSNEWWLKRASEGHKFRIVLPELHAGQLAVLRQARRLNFLAAGRGWRKSSLMLHLMYYFAFKKQKPVLWCSFTQDPITTIHTDHMQKMFGDDWTNVYDVTEEILQPPGWEPVYFGSMHKAANHRGKTPGLIIADEFGMFPDGVYTQILLPMVFKSKGILWAPGTPNPADPHNDLWINTESDTDWSKGWRIPVVGATYDKGIRSLVRTPHQYENPEYTFEELMMFFHACKTENQRIDFRIEFLVEFIAGGGTQIEDPRKVCTIQTVDGQFENELFAEGHRPRRNGYYQKAADIAVDRDFLAIGAMDLETNKQVYMRFFVPKQYDEKGKWEQLYKALKRCDDLYPGKFIVDTTGQGNHVEEEMAKRGVKIECVNFSGKNPLKVAMHDHLATIIEGWKIALFDNEELKKQLEGLKRKESATGAILIGNDVLKGKKTAKQDDLATMCALMCRDMDGGEVILENEAKPTVQQMYDPRHHEINPFAMIGEGQPW